MAQAVVAREQLRKGRKKEKEKEETAPSSTKNNNNKTKNKNDKITTKNHKNWCGPFVRARGTVTRK